jgi:hypothetical protein
LGALCSAGAPGGKFANDIVTANKLGSHRTIVPVQIIEDRDGQWDRAAWKTEAFYGNPLTGQAFRRLADGLD